MMLFGPFYVRTQHCYGPPRIVSLQEYYAGYFKNKPIFPIFYIQKCSNAAQEFLLFQSMLKKLDLEVWTVIAWSLLSIGMPVTSLILKTFSYNQMPSVMELLYFLEEYQHFTVAQKK